MQGLPSTQGCPSSPLSSIPCRAQLHVFVASLILRVARTHYVSDPPRFPKHPTSPSFHVHHRRRRRRHPSPTPLPHPAPRRPHRFLHLHREYFTVNICGSSAISLNRLFLRSMTLIVIVTHIRASTSSFGKSRPLPKIPKSPPPPPTALPATSPPPSRPRSPPPAWSPPQTTPVSRRSPPPTSSSSPSSSARPQRPKVMLPPTPPQRLSSATLRPASRIYSPPIDDDGSLTALPSAPLRVRPLPRRPPPPGPPGEGDTPVAQFGRVRWISEPSEEDESTLYDDRRAIDWDLIDEVMTHAN